MFRAIAGTFLHMEDRELARNAQSFAGSGTGILIVGLVIALGGGLVWLLGTGTDDVIQGFGGMVATIGGVIAAVGVVLLLLGAVTHRMARHRPFA